MTILFVLTLSACTTIKKDNFTLTDHVVMVDRIGGLVDQRANIGDPDSGQHLLFKPYPTLPDQEAYFKQLLSAVGEKTPHPSNLKKRRTILVFIHRGMNTARSSVARIVSHSDEIMKDGIYPIFINWDSSLNLKLSRQWGRESFKVVVTGFFPHFALLSRKRPAFLKTKCNGTVSLPPFFLDAGLGHFIDIMSSLILCFDACEPLLALIVT